MRAGFYVQSQPNSGVPAYDSALTGAIEPALTTLFNSPHFGDVSDGNGQVLGEAVITTDSAQVQGDFLGVYQRILNAYNSSWDAYSSMDNELNNVYTPLWNGNWNPAFVTAVTNNPAITDTLYSFAANHLSLLGGNNDVLDSNTGNDLGPHDGNHRPAKPGTATGQGPAHHLVDHRPDGQPLGPRRVPGRPVRRVAVLVLRHLQPDGATDGRLAADLLPV